MIVDLTGFSTGFCDRLRQLFYCVAIAEIRNDYVLKIREQVTDECPFLFYDLCTVDGFDLTQWQHSDGRATVLMDDTDSYPNSSSHAKRHCPTDISFSEDVLLEKWLQAYQRIRLRTNLLKKPQDLNVTSDCLGVHIRTTDRVSAYPKFYQINVLDMRRVEKNFLKIIKEKQVREGVFLRAMIFLLKSAGLKNCNN